MGSDFYELTILGGDPATRCCLANKQAAFAPFKKAKSRTGCLVLDFEGFAAAFAGAESEVGSETLVGLFD